MHRPHTDKIKNNWINRYCYEGYKFPDSTKDLNTFFKLILIILIITKNVSTTNCTLNFICKYADQF